MTNTIKLGVNLCSLQAIKNSGYVQADQSLVTLPISSLSMNSCKINFLKFNVFLLDNSVL